VNNTKHISRDIGTVLLPCKIAWYLCITPKDNLSYLKLAGFFARAGEGGETKRREETSTDSGQTKPEMARR